MAAYRTVALYKGFQMRYHLFQKFFGKMVKIKETSFLFIRGMTLMFRNCMCRIKSWELSLPRYPTMNSGHCNMFRTIEKSTMIYPIFLTNLKCQSNVPIVTTKFKAKKQDLEKLRFSWDGKILVAYFNVFLLLLHI